MNKTCSKCHQSKSTDEFYPRKSASDGLRSNCKSCMGSYGASTKARKSSYDRAHYQTNRAKRLERSKRYYEENRDTRRAYEKKILPRILAQRRRRYHSDPNYKLACNLRARVRSALKGRTKSAGTVALLGCSVEELKKHLESGFTEGMTWEKVMCGEIHIDHIRPCVTFDLSDPTQQRECFHYSNLRPLWAKDNLKRPKWKWKAEPK